VAQPDAGVNVTARLIPVAGLVIVKPVRASPSTRQTVSTLGDATIAGVAAAARKFCAEP